MNQIDYSVVVVEDEPLILNNIVKKIDHTNLGFNVIATARNGLKAQEILENLLPNVLVTDIRMPQVDGLELIRHVNEKYPSVRKVIISGYNDFEYARRAIGYNIKDFLLKPVEEAMLSSCLMRIRVELDAEYQSLTERLLVLRSAQGDTIQMAIEKVRVFLNENYKQELRIEQIASELNFNSSYLSKWFVKIVGESPSAYIIALRINKAKELLKTMEHMSVKQIGEEVGYQDQNYFSRIFKQVTGMSPVNYRAEE